MSETPVDAEDVEHIADLARLGIDESEAESFAEECAEILSYFQSLDEVPDVDREAELTNVMRPDEVHEGLTQDEALSNASESEDGYFKGPNVS